MTSIQSKLMKQRYLQRQQHLITFQRLSRSARSRLLYFAILHFASRIDILCHFSYLSCTSRRATLPFILMIAFQKRCENFILLAISESHRDSLMMPAKNERRLACTIREVYLQGKKLTFYKKHGWTYTLNTKQIESCTRLRCFPHYFNR